MLSKIKLSSPSKTFMSISKWQLIYNIFIYLCFINFQKSCMQHVKAKLSAEKLEVKKFFSYFSKILIDCQNWFLYCANLFCSRVSLPTYFSRFSFKFTVSPEFLIIRFAWLFLTSNSDDRRRH